MAVSRKYGRVTLERGTIGADEPVVVFRARDDLLRDALVCYIELCRIHGSSPEHIALCRATLDDVRQWQDENGSQIPRSEGYNPGPINDA